MSSMGGGDGDSGSGEKRGRSRRPTLNYAYPLRATSQRIATSRLSGEMARGNAGTNDGGERPVLDAPRSTAPETTATSRIVGTQEVELRFDNVPDEEELGVHPVMRGGGNIFVDAAGHEKTMDSGSASVSDIAPSTIPPPIITQPRRPAQHSLRRAGPSQLVPPSPIPEESISSRRESYASSAAIPSNWPSDSDPESDHDHDNELGLPIQGEEEVGLVRQASVGRKEKPTLMHIRMNRNSGSSETSSPKSPSFLTMPSPKGSFGAPPSPLVQPPSSPLAQPPVTPEHLADPEKKAMTERGSSDINLATLKELGFPASEIPAKPSPPRTRHVPTRLNIEAAEARGSLTSLHDLIRRATRLAATLESGNRPTSTQWGGRGSFFGFGASREPSSSETRDTSSLSSILASFPPPIFRRGRHSAWSLTELPATPLALDVEKGATPDQLRRICGLKVGLFVPLVLLLLVIITAAVVVPVQLVALSKQHKSARSSCANGGVSTAEGDKCICTDSFTGATCETKSSIDRACIEMSWPQGPKKVNIGSALPSLLEDASEKYHIPLDRGKLLQEFKAANVSCVLQNALVTFDAGDTKSFKGVAVLYIAQNRGILTAENAQEALTRVSSGNATVATAAGKSIVVELGKDKLVLEDGKVVSDGE